MSKAWRNWLVLVAAATAAYFFLGQDTQSKFYDLISLAAAGAMFVGLTVHRAEPRPAWMLIAFGILAFAGGDIAYGTYKPVPSVADMLYLTGYALLGAGMISLMSGRVVRRNRSALVDVAAVATAIIVASFVLLGRAYAKDVGTAGRAVALAYPLMDLVLIGLVARLAMTDRQPRPYHWLLGCAFVLLLIADVGYTLDDFGTGYSAGAALDAAWLMAYACFGAALLHPSLAPEKAKDPARALVSVGASTQVSRTRESMGSTLFQALRLRKVLRSTGLTALLVAAVALMAGVAWRSTEVVFMAGMYGTTGSVMLIAGAVGTYT